MNLLMKYISRTSRCARLYRNERLKEYGLNGHQHIYILNICRTPGISQEKLAALIHVDKSNVARQVALLEQSGFITRIPGETDKREMCVYPTEKALQTYPAVREVLKEWNDMLLEDLSEEEREELTSMMEKVMKRAALLTDRKANKKEML